MPGLENGSSFENAFTWDHTQYPGGTRVFGATTNYGGGGNTQDWWALYLLAGKTYVFQTRDPTAWDTYLYLYSPQGYYLTGDYDSGDDGHGLSKITYTTPSEGWYRLTLWGYYYYGEYGPYVLESVPAPKSFKNFLYTPSRFDSRTGISAAVPSRFEAIRERVLAQQAAQLDIRARLTGANAGRFSSRAGRETEIASRFNAIKTPSELRVPGRFDLRAGVNARSVARFSIRALQDLQVPARFEVRQVMNFVVPARFSVQGRSEAAVAARHDALVLPGWSIYARDTVTNAATFLGFIPADADPKELVDVPIPDGVWEIEVRPSQWYWSEARGRKVVTLVTDPAGGGGPVSGLPVIQNLCREIVGFQSLIRWDVAAEQAPGAFEFGLWFGAISPVDTSGPPDQTVPYVAGQGAYQVSRAQTASEYVAVAGFTATERGEVAELFLPWDATAPESPPNQFAQVPAAP
jgi:hypothetical protein